VNDAKLPGSTGYIWFDMEEYLLRRYRLESSGSIMDVSFTYEDISITEPSEVKILGPNQYILPGQNEPQTLTAAP
jgi:hypothetical protein